MGLFSSIVLTSLSSARSKAYNGQRTANLYGIRNALEIYYATNNRYPSTNGNYRSRCAIDGRVAPNSVIPGLIPTYLANMPLDPQVNIVTSQCCYRYRSDGTDYKFLFGATCPITTLCNPPPTTFIDPAHPQACAIYTPGALNW